MTAVQVVRDPFTSGDVPRGGVISIGNYDGVHLGHQAILARVVARARELGVPALAMTFDPHPLRLLDPERAPRLLTSLPQRLELLRRTGLDAALVVPFTARLARTPAEEFVRDVLARRLDVREVYIGSGFRFGAEREGTVDLLVALGRELGFRAEGIPAVTVDGEPVSSTRIRRAVAHGDVATAWRLLGRPLFVDGQVFRGVRLGRKLGFPTLNIAVENELYPAHGVYVTGVHIPSFGRTFPSVTNIGVRPTLYENFSTTVESHLLDFAADVYRERVRLFFFERLREERVFPSPMALVAQIRRDVEASRGWFAAHPMEELDLVVPSA